MLEEMAVRGFLRLVSAMFLAFLRQYIGELKTAVDITLRAFVARVKYHAHRREWIEFRLLLFLRSHSFRDQSISLLLIGTADEWLIFVWEHGGYSL